MPRLFLILLIIISANRAAAHIGMENDTEVRVYSDKMRVVTRTSIPFAWTVLGDRAPAMADEAGQAIAKPLLAAEAPGLISVTAGGKPLVAVQTECLFEVQNDVAFILNFERPTTWPVVLEAKFFKRFGNLETGKSRVFDYTASRFSRNLEPVVEKVIDQRNPSISFTLGATVPTPLPPETSAPTPLPPAAPTAGGFKKIAAISLLVIAAGIVFRLAIHRLRRAP